MKIKIVVPKGMLEAAASATFLNEENGLEKVIEAALRWLSEHPIMPSTEQLLRMSRQYIDAKRSEIDEEMILFIKHLVCAWQCRMFLAPKPEVPCAHVRTNSYHNFRNAQECVIGGKSNLPVIVCLDCGQIIDGRA